MSELDEFKKQIEEFKTEFPKLCEYIATAFRKWEDRRAWDKYATAAISCPAVRASDACNIASIMLTERQSRFVSGT